MRTHIEVAIIYHAQKTVKILHLFCAHVWTGYDNGRIYAKNIFRTALYFASSEFISLISYAWFTVQNVFFRVYELRAIR